jgi:nitroreductase
MKPVLAADVRPKCGNRGRKLGDSAPVRLIFVANLERYNHAGFDEPGLHDPEIQKSYYNVAIGLIAGNVHLFAASQGLAAWFHNCDKAALAADLKLGPDERVVYAQTVGYPA